LDAFQEDRAEALGGKGLFSVVIPVYRNADSLEPLVEALVEIDRVLEHRLEVVFVVDGSPDDSVDRLRSLLPGAAFRSQLIVLSRNFGSFAAVVAGFAHGQGDCFAVLAADLQDPPELVVRFRDKLASENLDVVVGVRGRRHDPPTTRLASAIFWSLYRILVQREMPAGGVDVFACTRGFRDELLALRERNTTLVGLVFWLGFARGELSYERRTRPFGRSAWSFWRRFRYLLDSCFAFSDLPIRLLSLAGMAGMTASAGLALVVLYVRLAGGISVPGYTATLLAVMFFGGLNAFGVGLIGEYVWRAFENTKGRPSYVVAQSKRFGGCAGGGA
jgi:glycosyltransferase involved in cell wall biosynthesis